MFFSPLKKIGPFVFLCFLIAAPAVLPAEIAWKFPTGGAIVYRPAVDGSGTAYFPSNDGNLYAVSSDGRELWQLQLQDTPSTPAVIYYDNSILLGTVSGKLLRIAANGVPKWELEPGKLAGDVGGRVTAIAVSGNGDILVASSSFLYCIDYGGRLKWRHGFASPIEAGPVVGKEGKIFITLGNRLAACLDSDGRNLWSYDSHFNARTIFLTSSNMLILAGRLILALSTEGAPVFTVASNHPIVSGIEGQDGNLYFTSDDGFLVSYSVSYSSGGEILYQVNLEGGERHISFMSEEGLIVLTGLPDGFQTFDISKRSLKRVRFSGVRNPEVVWAGKNQLYIASEDWNLYALHFETGDVDYKRWSYYLHDPRHTSRSLGLADGESGDYYTLLALASSPERQNKLSALEQVRDFLEGRQFMRLYAVGVEEIAGRLLRESVEEKSYFLMSEINDYPEVRSLAASVLGLLGTENARRLLVGHLGMEENRDVVEACIGALGEIGYDPDGSSVSAIVKHLDEGGVKLLLVAVQSLLEIARRNLGRDSGADALMVLARVEAGKYPYPVKKAAGDAIRESLKGKEHTE